MSSTQGSSQESIMDTTICPNCQRSIPTANFDVHCARCNRVNSEDNSSPQQQEPTNENTPEEQIDEPQQQEEHSNVSNGSTSNMTHNNNSFLTRGTGNSEWEIVNAAVMSSHRSIQASNRQTSQSDDTVQLRNGQWQCTRCTLINESYNVMCEACRRPRHSINSNANDAAALARRNRATTNRISSDALNGSSISYYSTMSNLSTGNRIVNGAINGAMVGSVVGGGVGGLIVGGITGALGGIIIDRIRSSRGEDLEDSEREMLLDRSESLPPNTMRVHRGENFITGASTNRDGITRVIRLRYSTGHLPGRAATDGQEQIERTFLQLLHRASLNRTMSHGSHVIIQPGATFEDLLERFGSGLEGREASQVVIDSYPVEIVGSGGQDGGSCKERSSSGKADNDGVSTKKKPKIDMGTCNICLEDYQAGEEVKSLSCPHTFHKGCIDQWLKRVACCPVCKADVGMYKKQN